MPVRLPARLTLRPHSASPAGPVHALTVDLDHHAEGGLRLSFALAHDGNLLIPAPQPPEPTDSLWAHTCCEAFVAVAGEAGYREYNFSPSGQWASYAFSAYRQRAATPDALPAPAIETVATPGLLSLHATLPAQLLPAAPPGRLLLLGLSAVCEARDGTLQYWALRHPAERPDFHHRRSFALAFAPLSASAQP